ncbi:MAG: TIGR01212 family radical SAM protein [Candidatus Dadabacteria bacterium]|nr:TIGR01212 family radical SAM protein [Candidatus Dadabacteria bacterium]NIV41059.1 TIGR01212 family radical SAM protein [Candidatus Dadabacteria bacterium]NIX14418.1 TIGR01212 family radical SAM protein [Candidatus Dadabacteria bacterium]
MQRYNSYSKYLLKTFGCKVNKISLDLGFTCPNRDGSKAIGGCIYCNNDTFVPPYARSRYTLDQQMTNGMKYLKARFKAKKFIAYFQAYTNTYSSVQELEDLYRQALDYEDVIGLAIGTRSDCIDEEKLDMIERLAEEVYVSLEYGIESIYDKTLDYMNRGHDYDSVLKAIELSKGRGLHLGVHIIVGFPTETEEQMLAMAKEVSGLGIDVLKVHNLHIVKNTPLARMYAQNPFHLFSYEEYLAFITKFIERVSPDVVIERLFTDTPHQLLIAPVWPKNHLEVLRGIDAELLKQDTYQGKFYSS